MSAGKEPDLARGWRGAMRVADEEAERLAKMSDEEFEAAMNELPETSGARVAALDTKAKRPRRPAWVLWAVAACVAALALAALLERREIVAFWHKGDIQPDQPRAPQNAPQDTPKDSPAQQLRAEALRACDEDDVLTCAMKLEEAKALDPAGEEDPRVQEARKKIQSAMPRHGPEGKEKGEGSGKL
jgi:hypothetical protein